jgi:putative transposase
VAKLYSLDLRERVAALALVKGSTRLAAETFSVSKATAVRWAKQLRDTGNVAIGDVGGHRPVILRNERAWLAARIAAEPHMSLRKLLSDLQVRGIAVSYGALWNFVHSEGLSFKKNSSRRRAANA